jgi:hypothetical protein
MAPSIFDPPQPFIDITSDDSCDGTSQFDDADVVMTRVHSDDARDPEETEDEEDEVANDDDYAVICGWCNERLGVNGAYGTLETADGYCREWVCEGCYEDAQGVEIDV